MKRPIGLGLLLGVALWLVAEPAAAQFNPFGWIFGEPPPRRAPPRDYPDRSGPDSWDAPRRQPQELPPPRRLPPGPPPASVRSQPLPPPPGAASAPTDLRGNSVSGLPPPLPPLNRPPRGRPRPGETQPGEEVPAAPPPEKVPNPTAVFSGLDKITGRIIKFDVAINETVQFGALQVTPRACYTRPPTETQNTDAFLEVDEVTLQGEVRRIFTGWMFAASPGLHAVEHPIYDVWLTDCKKEAPNVAVSTQVPLRH